MKNYSNERKYDPGEENLKKSIGETCYRFFSTLANPTRLAILELLREGPKHVSEIARVLGQEQSMISHNLQSLKDCNFVFSEPRKKERFYSLNKETMEPVFKIFLYHSEKHCPTPGKCLSSNSLKTRKRQDASNEMYLTHQ